MQTEYPATTDVVKPMTKPEAKRCIVAIENKGTETRQLLLDLRDREGWKALGYTSFYECLRKEFNRSRQTYWRIVRAADVEASLLLAIDEEPELGNIMLPTVKGLGLLHLLELEKLDEPALRLKALENARQTAKRKTYVGKAAKYNNPGKVTSAMIQNAVSKLLPHLEDELEDTLETLDEPARVKAVANVSTSDDGESIMHFHAGITFVVPLEVIHNALLARRK